MSDHCNHTVFTGQSVAYKRTLCVVAFLNLVMFALELGWGIAASSQALLADSCDLLGDGLTYSLSLWAIHQSLRRRSIVAMIKGVSLLLFAIFILVDTVIHIFLTHTPAPLTMGWVATSVLIVNILCAFLLYRFRDGDANIRSVWLCSRNDAIGNILVMIAAGAVFLFKSGWPDLVAAGILVLLFLSSARRILQLAWQEITHQKNHALKSSH